MTTAPRIGLALIARNEQETLPTLLASVEGAFDRVVLLDTGSTDDTVRIFDAWCDQEAARQKAFSHATGHMTWEDDFAAARAMADSLLQWGDAGDGNLKHGPLVDWLVWADADDELAGAQHIRTLCAQAPPGLAGFIADYAYAHDPHGNVVCVLRRERIVRAGAGTWEGKVHEAQTLNGGTLLVDPKVCRWIHRKQPTAPDSSARNLKILEAWNAEEPDNSRVVGYLGTEYLVRGDHETAEQHFRAYLGLKTGWDEERAQIHRKLGVTLMAQNRPQEALETALAALAVVPDWPDSRLTLAEACYRLNEFDKAAKWARDVLRLGQPDTLLILNPLDYTFSPRLVLAAALGALGEVEEAAAIADEALQLVPDHQELRRHQHGWRATVKREHVANSWIGAAQLLVAHDEQLKALHLLEETVPHFAQDHPRVVAIRSELRERVGPLLTPAGQAEHYLEATEVGIPDLAICDLLPRAAFLRDGIRDQIAEAA